MGEINAGPHQEKGQSLVIGWNIRIVVVEVTGHPVCLGIEAPPEVAIYRDEIYRAGQEENRTALVARELAARLSTQVETKNEKAARK